MNISDFDFDLPKELIAQIPCNNRTDSKLMTVNAAGEIKDELFTDIIHKMHAEDVLVLNNTKVIPARLYGKKAATSGKIEILVERIIDDYRILVHLKASNSPTIGQILDFSSYKMQVLAKTNGLYELQSLNKKNIIAILNEVGKTPLPPYITKSNQDLDKTRYQTVYAEKKGAAAAPTAGLHFDQELLAKIKAKGIKVVFITLHVGAGTFKPISTPKIEEHKMHAEYIEIPEITATTINAAKKQGSKIIATGTTSVRTLEAVAQIHNGKLAKYSGFTNIFIYPGFKFNIIDAMITNFHLPKSTLMLLVSAFTNQNTILNAYKSAIAKKYRFFSYGDAMFLNKFTKGQQ